jgi:hypothetical protein
MMVSISDTVAVGEMSMFTGVMLTGAMLTGAMRTATERVAATMALNTPPIYRTIIQR